MRNSKVKSVKIVGVIPSFPFQRAKALVLELHRCMPSRFPPPEIDGILELEWFERLTEWRRVSGSDFWRLKRPVAVFLDGVFIGSDVELLKLTSVWGVLVESVPRRDSPVMKRQFGREYLACLRDTKLTHCYLDICVDDAFIGTLVFKLYSDKLPRTCDNFTTLCLGKRGSFFSYKGSRIHRIVRNGWLQGGDIQYTTGGGGYSVYCGPLEDESYAISHDRRGVLSMANDGKHTNGSQFFVTLGPSTWMDTLYVAFGQLVEGVSVLNALENVETFRECPLKRIEIKNCGKLNLQDVDDIDAVYEPCMTDARLRKKPKIETIADQVVRLVMEAVTDMLAVKEHAPDVTHPGDAPSVMSLDMYFRGLYSIPDDVLEDAAKCIRTNRREFLRNYRPIATEVVEVITYDLLAAVFTKLVDLDDVREALTRSMYAKLIGGIDVKVETTEKAHVKKFVDQLTATAETMLKVLARKLTRMRRKSVKARYFQDQMNDWVKSFALQETFADDSYRICYKRDNTTEEEDPCAEKTEARRYGREPTAVELCCGGKPSEDEPTLSDFFSSCRYQLKTVDKLKGRISLVELIERGRYQLRVLRHQEQRYRTKGRICLERRINRWMKDVAYTTETDWIRQTVFAKDDACLIHAEEIMYGAMTIGLLEIYYLMDSHLRKPRRKRYITRVVYPEDEDGYRADEDADLKGESSCSSGSEIERTSAKSGLSGGKKKKKNVKLIPCSCGDVCCDCAPKAVEDDEEDDKPSDTGSPVPPTPPPSERTSNGAGDEASSCFEPDEAEAEELLAEVMGESRDKVSVKSFRWMQSYIEEMGCEFKSEFAGQVHNWLENDVFRYRGFLSKHSLVTRASLLSFSLSIASLIKEENRLKSELKDFVFDLWELYFREMMKEAVLENPPESIAGGEVGEDEGEEVAADEVCSDPCGRVKSLVKEDFDFDTFCLENAPVMHGEDAGVELPVEEGKAAVEPVVEEGQVAVEPVVEEEKASVEPTVEEVVPDVEKEELPKEVKEEEVKPKVIAEVQPEVKEEVNEGQEETAKTKEPRIIKELIKSSEEIRPASPYAPPFWIAFLTEITKRALGLIAKSSRLPRRLYHTTDSQISFDDKLKEWFEYNNFGAPVVGERDLRDFIAKSRVELVDLDATARSFLRKRRISQLIERSSRESAAKIISDELVLDVQARSMEMIAANDGNVPMDVLTDLVATVATDWSDVPEEEEVMETELLGE